MIVVERTHYPSTNFFRKAIGRMQKRGINNHYSQRNERQPKKKKTIFILFKERKCHKIKWNNKPQMSQLKFERNQWFVT